MAMVGDQWIEAAGGEKGTKGWREMVVLLTSRAVGEEA